MYHSAHREPAHEVGHLSMPLAIEFVHLHPTPFPHPRVEWRRYHLGVHTNNRPFRCTVMAGCNASFPTAAALNAHVTNHVSASSGRVSTGPLGGLGRTAGNGHPGGRGDSEDGDPQLEVDGEGEEGQEGQGPASGDEDPEA
jgi:hypothetical protein